MTFTLSQENTVVTTYSAPDYPTGSLSEYDVVCKLDGVEIDRVQASGLSRSTGTSASIPPQFSIVNGLGFNDAEGRPTKPSEFALANSTPTYQWTGSAWATVSNNWFWTEPFDAAMSPKGYIAAVSGACTVTRSSAAVINAVIGTGVIAGDTISTPSSGAATFAMNDGTSLVCQPSTAVVVDNYSYTPSVAATNSFWARVTQGVVRVATGAINILNPGGFRLITPQVVFGVRGTNFTVTVTDTGTVITVTSGTVLATSGSQTYTINAGESMSFPLGASPVVLGEAVTSLPLPAGRYQVAVTYLRNDGQESGASRAETITLTAKGGISLSSIPVSTDPTVTHKAIYMTPTDGETLFRVGVIPNADTTFMVRELRKGASPLLTQFLSPPPAGDFIASWKGWMLVAKGARLYPSEVYAPELFDLRKSLSFGDRITMIAPVKSGVWIGTDSQVLWMEGASPETWTFAVAAEYGVIPGTLAFGDGDILGDSGQASGAPVAFFATKRGLGIGRSDGAFANLTQARFAYSIQERGAGIVRRHRGMAQFLVTLQGAETAGNVAS